MSLQELKDQGLAPDFLQEDGYTTLSNGYLLDQEVPLAMYKRVAASAASYYKNSKYWYNKFFDAMWQGWLCPASPVLANLGTKRGLPISCNSIHIDDSVDSIFRKNHELAILGKNGAGVGIYLGDIRCRNSMINGNGRSEGVVPWSKLFDTSCAVISQGSTRRGAAALYLPIEHGDIDEFLDIRRPVGDLNRRCLNIHHAVTITDKWMKDMLAGDTSKQEVYKKVLKSRVETGEPYIFFTDSVNNNRPECYKKNNLFIKTSNICCLSGDTPVLTSNGSKRIDTLLGKTVSIWDGENWVENDQFKCYGEDFVYRIYLANGSHVDANSMHRWFAAKSYSDITQKRYDEIRTKDLNTNMWLESHSQEYHGEQHVPGAYLKGFLIGDGTKTVVTENNKIPILYLHAKKYACMDRLISSAKEIQIQENLRHDCISEPGFGEEHDNTGLFEGVYGEQITRRMQGLTARRNELFPWAGEYKKFIPSEVFEWNYNSKLEFIAGLLDSDGTLGKHWSAQITSIEKQFIYDLQLLLRSFAVDSNIDAANLTTNLGRKPTYRLTISSYDFYYKLYNQLNLQRLHSQDSVAPNRKSTGWRKITRIEKLPEKMPVYCTSVPSTTKFALSGGLMTGNSEITEYTDPEHTFVCCLSSLNLTKWDEWKDTDLPQTAVRFLDAVMQEYIDKSQSIPGLECSRRSAVKERSIGIGVLGYHSLLQSKNLPFDSFQSMMLNNQIFKTIKEKAEIETAILAKELGEPEWCKGFGRRNSHVMALAPTVSNSTIVGGVSPSIEPWTANIFSQKSAKGTFIKRNPYLEKILQEKGEDTEKTWKSIIETKGSVQQLSCLNAEEKAVFLTAREINQFAIIKQAVQRQKYIDQAQSLNLFFSLNADPKYIHNVHVEAWKGGLKTLYYMRTEGVLRGDMASRSPDECVACGG